MNNHQLIVSGDAQEIRTPDGNMVATTDHHLVRRARSEKQALVREIVRRFNAHKRLVDRLESLMNAAKFVDSMMDGDKDKQRVWKDELDLLYVEADEAKVLLKELSKK